MPKVRDKREGGMRYTYRGRVFPSVTTIISGGVPKPLLVPWAAKVTAEYVVENIEKVNALIADDPVDALTIIKNARYKATNSAALKGTKLHDYAEKHVNGEELPEMDRELRGSVQSFLRFIDEYQPEPVLTECKVFSLAYDYAGTFDAIVTIDGDILAEEFANPDLAGAPRNVLLDYKTGKGVYGEVALQLSAYRFAEFWLDEDGATHDLPQIDCCAAIHIRPRSYRFIPVRADEEVFKFFRAVRKVYDFTNASDSLVGK